MGVGNVYQNVTAVVGEGGGEIGLKQARVGLAVVVDDGGALGLTGFGQPFRGNRCLGVVPEAG